MFRLVLKDFATARWLLLAGLPLYAVQLGPMVLMPPVYLLMTVLFSATLAFGSIALEEVQGTDVLWASLPLSRRQIVFGRYLTTLAGALLGLGISFAVGLAAGGILDGAPSEASRPEPATYAILLAFLLLVAAGYLPMLFRLGAGRGLIVFAAAAVGLLLLLALLGSLVAPASGAGATAEQLEAAEAWLERWRGAMAAGLLGLSAVAMLVSAGLSVRLFEGRDL